mmetsp:Transcript_6715/g.17974  ORF Transcript_6715/g.17974 Transcript_6715/m.17974 type:complete len:106 (+) Transcript_6715:458-775(+)
MTLITFCCAIPATVPRTPGVWAWTQCQPLIGTAHTANSEGLQERAAAVQQPFDAGHVRPPLRTPPLPQAETAVLLEHAKAEGLRVSPQQVLEQDAVGGVDLSHPA